MFEATVHGELKTYFNHQQDAFNAELLSDAKTAISGNCMKFNDLRNRLRELIESRPPFAESDISDFFREFRGPLITPVTVEQICTDLSLATQSSVLSDLKNLMEVSVPETAAAFARLDKDLLKKDLDACLTQIKYAFESTVGDASAEEVSSKLYALLHSRSFVFAHHELEKLNRKLEPLTQELKKAHAAHIDALQLDKLKEAEEFAQQELGLLEKCLKICREMVDAASSTISDANEFFDALRSAEEMAEKCGIDMQSAIDSRRAQAHSDSITLAQKVASDRDRFEQAKTAAEANAKALQERAATVIRQRDTLWMKMIDLLAEDAELETEWQNTLTEHLNLHAEITDRGAYYNAYMNGLQNTADALVDFTSLLAKGDQLKAHFVHHTEAMLAAIDARGIDEEALKIRHDRQLQYLDFFTKYWLASATLAHRKETRAHSTARLIRNLEMQIREARQVLDSRKPMYEREIEELSQVQSTIWKEVEALQERQKKEKDLWDPVQQQLEEDAVPFEPPEVTVNKHVLQLKSETIDITRRFVVGEQDTVDRDTVQLRKLRVVSQVQVEQLQQRRQDRGTPQKLEE